MENDRNETPDLRNSNLVSYEQSKTWKLLNSNLFLWMVGAIFLSLVPFIYDQCKSASNKKERLAKLDFEMQYRFNQLVALINRDKDSSSKSNYRKYFAFQNSSDTHYHSPAQGWPGIDDNPKDYLKDSVHIGQLLYQFALSPSQNNKTRFYPAFKEFEDYSTVSVLIEIISLEKDTSQRENLNIVLDYIMFNKLIPFDPIIPSEKGDNIIKFLQDSLILNRWKKGNFPKIEAIIP